MFIVWYFFRFPWRLNQIVPTLKVSRLQYTCPFLSRRSGDRPRTLIAQNLRYMKDRSELCSIIAVPALIPEVSLVPRFSMSYLAIQCALSLSDCSSSCAANPVLCPGNYRLLTYIAWEVGVSYRTHWTYLLIIFPLIGRFSLANFQSSTRPINDVSQVLCFR